MAQAIDDNLYVSVGDIDGLIVVGELPLVKWIDPIPFDLNSLKVQRFSASG